MKPLCLGLVALKWALWALLAATGSTTAQILPFNPTTTATATATSTAIAGVSLDSPRIMGLGVALFALLVVGIVFVIITLLAAQSGYGWSVGAVLAVLYAVAVGILVSVPKLAPGESAVTPPAVDATYHGRMAFTVLAGLFGFGALIAACVWHCIAPASGGRRAAEGS